MKKLIIPEIYLKNGLCGGENPVELAKYFSEAGADAIILYDLSSEDEEHEINLHTMKEIYRVVEIPLFGAGNITAKYICFNSHLMSAVFQLHKIG